MSNRQWMVTVLVGLGSWASMAGRVPAADWPQWLGPDRNGVAAASPKLLDAWPTNGPAQLWQSEPLGPAGNDGYGSVVVADGRAYVFVNSKSAANQGVPADFLDAWGWREGVPTNLAARIEGALNSEKRRSIKGGIKWKWTEEDRIPEIIEAPELDAYINEFLATLNAETVKTFGDHIRRRLKVGAFNWQTMTNLGAWKGKTIPSEETFRSLFVDIPGHSPLKDVITAEAKLLFGARDTIVCLDAGTGREVWRREFPGVAPAGESYAASGTPAVSEGKVYVTGSAGVYCLAAGDGAEIWQAKCDFNHSSPLVVDGRVIYMDRVVLAARDAATGRLLWRQENVKQDHRWWGISRSVALWRNGGKNYLIGAGGPGLWCVEPEKGEMVWTRPGEGGGIVRSTPILAGDVAVVSTDDKVHAFRLAPDKAELLWSAPGGDRGGSAMVYQDDVYIGGNHLGGLQCLDLKTGAVRWKETLGTTEGVTPVAADGKIFFNTGETVIMVRASPEKCELLGKLAHGQVTICTTPAVAGGRLYLRQKTRITCYDIASPRRTSGAPARHGPGLMRGEP